jgi:signal transduction histidine kinase
VAHYGGHPRFVVNNENRGVGHKRSVGTLAVAMPPLGPTLAYKIWRSHGQRRRAAVNIPHKRGIIHMASVLAPSFYPPRGIFPIVFRKSHRVLCSRLVRGRTMTRAWRVCFAVALAFGIMLLASPAYGVGFAHAHAAGGRRRAARLRAADLLRIDDTQIEEEVRVAVPALVQATNDGVYEIWPDGELRRVLDERAFAMHSSSPSSNVVYVGLKNGLAVLHLLPSGWRETQIIAADEIVDARSIVSRPDGSLWVVTLSGSLFQLRQTAGAYHYDRLGPEYGVPDRVASLHLGFNGRIWLMSPDAIYTLDEDRNRFVRDGRFDGLIDFSEEEGYLISAGPYGMTWVINAGVIRAFVDENGPLREVTPPALGLGGLPVRYLAIDGDGVVWIAAGQGLLRFDPRIHKDYAVPYAALIRSVTSNGGRLLFGGAGAGLQHVPLLPFKQNNLRFEVAAASFNQPEATQYQYWLEGFDATWSDWSSERFKEYTNLPEGRYRFHVRARNAHGVISAVDTFAFTVLPPWYRTWWAYLLYAMAAVTVVTGYSRWQLRKHVHEMERERRVRRELEMANQRLIEANRRLHEADRLKDDLLANTSHALRTPLTAILGFAAVLEDELEQPQRDFAEHIHKSGQRLLQTVDGLLNMARLQADTMELEAQEFDLAAAIHEAVERLRPDAPRHDIAGSVRMITYRRVMTTVTFQASQSLETRLPFWNFSRKLQPCNPVSATALDRTTVTDCRSRLGNDPTP